MPAGQPPSDNRRPLVPPRGRQASLKDVALESGVSPGTVSNVFNHPERVTDVKRLRVEDAVRRLGYVRNESARQLRAGRSKTLGLLLLDAWNPFFTEMARGVEDWAFGRGWAIFISNSARQTEREEAYLDLFAERRVEGIIVVPRGDLTARLADLRLSGIPSVMLDQPSPDTGSMSVSLDDVRGGWLAMSHLIDQGHRRVTFVGDPNAVTQVRNRLDGATKATAESTAPVELSVLEPLDLTVAAGCRIAEQLLASEATKRPSALFAANDLLAIGIMQVLVRARVRVPEDIAIVGYDDNEFAQQVIVPLTSIRQPAYEMGRKAAQLIITKLTGGTVRQPHVVFEPRLVARESTMGHASSPLHRSASSIRR